MIYHSTYLLIIASIYLPVYHMGCNGEDDFGSAKVGVPRRVSIFSGEPVAFRYSFVLHELRYL